MVKKPFPLTQPAKLIQSSQPKNKPKKLKSTNQKQKNIKPTIEDSTEAT